jgi:hypothetical protein
MMGLPVDCLCVAQKEPPVAACAVGHPQIPGTVKAGATCLACSYKRDLPAVRRPPWLSIDGNAAFFHAYFQWDEYERDPLANTFARRMGSDTGSLGSASPQGAETLPATSCGNLLSASITGITARGLSCVRARRAVRQFLSNYSGDPCVLTANHFYCTTRDASYRYSHIGCAYQPDLRKPIRSQRTVLFQTNE